MVRKKPGKWFDDENIQRITIKGEKYIYWKKKKVEKTNLVIPIEKKSKDTQLVGQKKKKNTVRAAKLLSGDTKRTFSRSDLSTSAIIIKLSLLCFQRNFVIHLCCQIIYSVMETNHLKH